jgi:phosphoglycerate kinase
VLNFNSYNFKDKRVLVRVDFNVPLNEYHHITDDTRIQMALPTLQKILSDGGSLIIMTHIGRPKGEVVADLSVKHIAAHLSRSLGRRVKVAPDCVGNEVKTMAETLEPQEVLLLENLRFHKEETKGDEEFAKQLSELGDVFVLDAFGAVHRAHASISVIAKFFQEKMFGLLVEKELFYIDRALKKPEAPFTAIIGGAKVSTKIDIILNLLDKVDNMIVAGGIAYTIIKAQGGKVGNSLVEDDFLDVALKIVEKAKEKNVNLVLPTDSIGADKFDNEANIQLFNGDIDDGWMGLDIGIKSANNFSQVIESSKTILWNGPIGVFEFRNFSFGTLKVALSVAAATRKGAYSLVGGGDSVAAIHAFNLESDVSYISTAGGALLEYIEGKPLPGIVAIRGEE